MYDYMISYQYTGMDQDVVAAAVAHLIQQLRAQNKTYFYSNEYEANFDAQHMDYDARLAYCMAEQEKAQQMLFCVLGEVESRGMLAELAHAQTHGIAGALVIDRHYADLPWVRPFHTYCTRICVFDAPLDARDAQRVLDGSRNTESAKGIVFDFDLSNEEVRFDGTFLKTTTQQIRGEVFERTYLGSGVAVIPMDLQEKKILLVKEFRVHYGTDGASPWKLVTGWMEQKHASFLEAAQQELHEEVGAHAQGWALLYDAHHRATISSRKQYFTCHSLVFDDNAYNPDNDVILTKRWVDEQELWHMITHHDITWTRDVLAALIAMRSLSQN
jgi:8-oxo-dGTP pyrophosphatase MutT (NUDIX family)